MSSLGAVSQSRSDDWRGAGFILLAMGGYAFNDLMVKSAAAHIPASSILVIRSILAAVFLLAILALRRELRLIGPSLRGRALLRSVADSLVTGCYVYALSGLSLANAAAIYQLTPIVVMLMSAVLLREAIALRGWLGALLGFSGMLLVVQPDGEMLNPYALAVVAAVLFSVLRDLLMRGGGGVSASPFCLGMFSAICAMVLGFATAGDAGVLVPASAWEILLLLLAAGGIAVGYVFLALGTSVGNSGFVSPFRYSMLIYAVIFGALVLGDLPDGLALIGVALIVAGGVVVSAPPDLWLRALIPLRLKAGQPPSRATAPLCASPQCISNDEEQT